MFSRSTPQERTFEHGWHVGSVWAIDFRPSIVAVFAAALTRLNTMSLAGLADKAPFVRTVRCRTVANTLSIAFDVPAARPGSRRRRVALRDPSSGRRPPSVAGSWPMGRTSASMRAAPVPLSRTFANMPPNWSRPLRMLCWPSPLTNATQRPLLPLSADMSEVSRRGGKATN